MASGYGDFDMNKFVDYLAFREFVTPYALQILFWTGIGGVLYGTWWLILKYRTYLCLSDMRNKLGSDERPQSS